MILLDKQKKFVWLAVREGWIEEVGYIVNIDGIELSAVRSDETLLQTREEFSFIFSSLKSGQRLVEVPVDAREFYEADTKGKVMAIYYKKCKIVQEFIEKHGIDFVKGRDEKAREFTVEYFGERPEIEGTLSWRSNNA